MRKEALIANIFFHHSVRLINDQRFYWESLLPVFYTISVPRKIYCKEEKPCRAINLYDKFLSEVGIYKRKQVSKKTRFLPRKRSKKKAKKHAHDQENKNENKTSTKK